MLGVGYISAVAGTALAAASPAPVGAGAGEEGGFGEAVLVLDVRAAIAAEALAEALASRVGRPVMVEPDAAVPADAAWVLEVADGPDGQAVILLRSPDGRAWRREVELGGGALPGDTVRAIALAGEYLLSLAAAPFPVPVAPSPPTPPETAAPVLFPRVGSSAPSAAPAAGESPGGAVRHDRGSLRLAVEVGIGGAGDLPGDTQGLSRALVVTARPVLEWSWGLAVHVEAGWRYTSVSRPIDAALHVAPLRVGVGAVIPAGEWRWRLAFQAVAERWWTEGEGQPRSGWRSGGGLLFSGAVALLPWLSVGGDVGVDLLPHGIELFHYEEPVFSMGQWRWRAGLWVALGHALGM